MSSSTSPQQQQAAESHEIEEAYEFDAPQFRDFNHLDAEEQNLSADSFFDAQSHAPSIAPSEILNEIEEVCDELKQEVTKAAGKRLSPSEPEDRPSKKQRLTVPKTPKFMRSTRSRSKLGQKTTAQIQAEKLQQEREARRRQEMAKLKKAKSVTCKHLPHKELTKPATPEFARPKSARPTTAHAKTTEEIELERAQMEATEFKAERELKKSQLKKVLSSSRGPNTMRSVKPLTQPMEFNFRTDSRIKPHAMELRETPARKEHAKKRAGVFLTEPKPFSFATDSRIKATEAHESSTPLGEKMNKYYKTPARFRTKKATENKPELPEKNQMKLTNPKTPAFHSTARHRTVEYKSKDEREAEEMATLKPFKARPIDPRIMESNGDYGVPRVPKRALTAPKTPHFATDDRAERIREREAADFDAEEDHVEFKARPLDMRMLEGATFQPKSARQEFVPTVPKTPALATKTLRSTVRHEQLRKEQEELEKQKGQFKAQPIMMGSPFKVHHDEEHKVEVRPFNLRTDERHVKHSDKLQGKLNEQAEAEAASRQFKAQPIVESLGTVRPVQKKELTEPKPFNLQSERLHNQAVEHFERKKVEESTMEKQMREFHARGVPEAAPFVPKPSTKPLTDIQDVHFASHARAESRAAFDSHIRSEQDRKAALLKKQEEERAEKENAELVEMRKKMNFKANPVPHYPASPKTLKSTKALTEPKTPNLNTALRNRNVA